MINTISLIMAISAIVSAVIKAEQTAAAQPGETKLQIATAMASAAINGMAPHFISTTTATWLLGILTDAINAVVALLNVIGVFKHTGSPAS